VVKRKKKPEQHAKNKITRRNRVLDKITSRGTFGKSGEKCTGDQSRKRTNHGSNRRCEWQLPDA
jgi:hypothetical protein